MWATDCDESLATDASVNLFPRTCCTKHKKHDKREPGLLKEEFKCSEMLCLRKKTSCSYYLTSNKLKFRSKYLNRWVLEQIFEGRLEKYRKVLDEAVNIKWTNGSFCTKDHIVRTYELTNEDYRLSIQTELLRTIQFTQTHWICRFIFLSLIFCVVFVVLLRSK